MNIRKIVRLLFISCLFLFYTISIGCSGSSNEIVPDFVLPDVEGSQISLSSLLDDHKHVVIVFYRGHFWGICRSQLVELQQFYQEFLNRDAEIVTISMDNLENAKAMTALTGARYQLLYDSEGVVVRRYGVYNLLGDGVSAPSVFIIGKNRSLEWSYVGKNAGDRPTIDDILSKID